MPEPDYAKIAYEAYVWHLDRTHVATMPLPAWEAVRQDIKDAWQAAIDAVFNAQIPGDAP